ncbi:putative mitogen-activated protein (MAP) kinase kinase kinase 14 [Plasmopara halstedii]
MSSQGSNDFLSVNSTAVVTPTSTSDEFESEQAYLLSRLRTLQLFLLLGYSIMCLLCITLVIYLRLNRNTALRGDATAARKIILPAFEPLLWVLGLSTGIYSIFFASALATKLYSYKVSRLATEVFYSGRQFVCLSVIVFMFQKSVSGPALRRTLLITLFLSTYTIPFIYIITTYFPTCDYRRPLIVARGLLLLLYTYVLIHPPARASKRTLREYCVFVYIYYILLFAYVECFRQGHKEAGFYLTYSDLICGSFCPLVIWRVLRADTEYWRGMGQRAVALQRLFCQNHGMPERVSSKGLHILIEMHRKFIIDFAYLELQHRIGIGASSVVFKGVLRSSMDVAIKVYTPTEFTEDTVAAFSQEAALCGVLYHPNIVAFHGMCVCPPSICLVSELCIGNLEDVTIAAARQCSTMSKNCQNRQQLLLNIAYMLDAARAVAYLHSFRPPFLHRDIKPTNFLVDANNTVKLTDFGESRSLPRAQVVSNEPMKAFNATHRSSMSGYYGDKASTVAILASEDSNAKFSPECATYEIDMIGAANVRKHNGSVMTNEFDSIRNIKAVANEGNTHVNTMLMTVKGTVDYMAPEVINGRAGLAAYGEAADVFSLAITMWDVFYPGREKFPGTNNNHFRVFDLVLEGQRPELDRGIHSSLRAVIESAWQHDPQLRPTAHKIVKTLESIQEELSAAFALELTDELEDALSLTKPVDAPSAPLPTLRGFSGEEAIHHMRQLQYVNTTSEAVRLGNALMDSGLLHHCKHTYPFEASDKIYYFDDENIHLCQPLVEICTQEYKTKLDVESTTVMSSNTHPSHHIKYHSDSTNFDSESTRFRSDNSQFDQTQLKNGVCECRKLGQRLKLPKSSKSRNRFRRRGKGKKESAGVDCLSGQLQTKLLLEFPLEHHDFDDFDAYPSSEI